MKKHFVMRYIAQVGVVSGLVLASIAPMRAQAAQTTPAQPVLVKVDVVLSRSQGDKKISNLPFSMLLSSAGYGESRSMRVGVDVPVGNSTIVQGPSPSSSNPTTTTSSRVDYRNIGTSIDARVGQSVIVDNRAPVPLEAGRFLVDVRVSDTAIFGASDSNSPSAFKGAEASAFRTFTMSNAMVMRDGQTLQFATATDKTSGETLKLDVTLTVVK